MQSASTGTASTPERTSESIAQEAFSPHSVNSDNAHELICRLLLLNREKNAVLEQIGDVFGEEEKKLGKQLEEEKEKLGKMVGELYERKEKADGLARVNALFEGMITGLNEQVAR